MKTKIQISLAFLFFGLMALGGITNAPATESIEWNVLKTLKLEAKPVDVVITTDGKRIFVLTERGEILIYSSLEKPDATIHVGDQIDQMKLGPGENTLILTSRDKKSVQLVTLDFIQNIDISDSPTKGSEDAPVVIAVFSDFQ